MSVSTITSQQARMDAIEASGVANRFVIFQPRNLAMWVYAWALVAGAIRIVGYFEPGVANYGGALLGGSIGYALYTAVWIAFLHSFDRFAPLPGKVLWSGSSGEPSPRPHCWRSRRIQRCSRCGRSGSAHRGHPIGRQA